MAVGMYFHRQNIKPSINICRVGVSGLEETLKNISGVLFEPHGAKWLKSSGAEKQLALHATKLAKS